MFRKTRNNRIEFTPTLKNAGKLPLLFSISPQWKSTDKVMGASKAANIGSDERRSLPWLVTDAKG
jgi:hypothetical protein